MRTIVASAMLLLLWTVTSPVQAQSDVRPFFLVGIGRSSCATWLSSRDTLDQGKVWILGFWSGMNMWYPDRGDIGGSTDAEGIFGEVRKRCTDQPSMPLFQAVTLAFTAMARGRP